LPFPHHERYGIRDLLTLGSGQRRSAIFIKRMWIDFAGWGHPDPCWRIHQEGSPSRRNRPGGSKGEVYADPAWWKATAKASRKACADPALKKANAEASKKRSADQAWQEAHAKRMKKMHADPAWRKGQAERTGGKKPFAGPSPRTGADSRLGLAGIPERRGQEDGFEPGMAGSPCRRTEEKARRARMAESTGGRQSHVSLRALEHQARQAVHVRAAQEGSVRSCPS
jgi:hypothetical protein